MKLLLKLVLLLSCYKFATVMAGRVGGISDDEKSANEDVQNMLTALSSEIKLGALQASAGADGVSPENLENHLKTASITPLGHKTQVVAGVNYFVRTKIGDYIFHVRIYRDLKKNASVTKVIGPKQESDPIEYF